MIFINYIEYIIITVCRVTVGISDDFFHSYTNYYSILSAIVRAGGVRAGPHPG